MMDEILNKKQKEILERAIVEETGHKISAELISMYIYARLLVIGIEKLFEKYRRYI